MLRLYSLFLSCILVIASPGSFLHMTDIHVSVARPYSLENLERFCKETLPRILSESPSILFLAVTGDLTDGVAEFLSLGAFGQQAPDWVAYESAMESCFATNLPIFKIRGNHDCFGVHSFHHPTNEFFRAVQRHHGKSTPKLTVDALHGSYGFTIDGVNYVFLEMGRIVPSPHQYHGEFAEDQALWLNELVERFEKKSFTYVFGHYPIGSLTPASRARLLTALAPAHEVFYLSGHIHSVVGATGVQCLDCHQLNIHELQLSDFKWSGIVRQVGPNGVFSDIPASEPMGAMVRATVQNDILIRRPIISVYALERSSVKKIRLSDGTLLEPRQDSGELIIFDYPSDTPIPKTVDVVFQDGPVELKLVDARLPEKSFARILFTRWFECFQVMLFLMYCVLVWLAWDLKTKRGISPLFSLYLLLSPILPSVMCQGLFGRHYVLASGIGLWDLETNEFVLDSESTRVALMFFVLTVLSIGIMFKHSGLREKTRRWNIWADRIVSLIGLVSITLVSLIDFRMLVARGHISSAVLSPHFWFVVSAWTILLSTGEKRKIE
jgi:hypothetical protein